MDQFVVDPEERDVLQRLLDTAPDGPGVCRVLHLGHEVLTTVREARADGRSWDDIEATLAEGAERGVRFGFSVADEAPVGESALLRFAITEADGYTLSQKAVRLQVAAPQKLELKGNAPNPFRRQTTLRYVLPEAAEVTAQVYDVLGRRVARLEPGRQEAGLQAVQWAPRRMASGAYFYRLVARTEEDRRVEQGRMTILR